MAGWAVVAAFRGLGWLIGLGWSGWTFWALLPALFAASVAASLVLFLAVERPVSLKPRRAPGAATQPAAP